MAVATPSRRGQAGGARRAARSVLLVLLSVLVLLLPSLSTTVSPDAAISTQGQPTYVDCREGRVGQNICEAAFGTGRRKDRGKEKRPRR